MHLKIILKVSKLGKFWCYQKTTESTKAKAPAETSCSSRTASRKKRGEKKDISMQYSI